MTKKFFFLLFQKFSKILTFVFCAHFGYLPFDFNKIKTKIKLLLRIIIFVKQHFLFKCILKRQNKLQTKPNFIIFYYIGLLYGLVQFETLSRVL